jgi:hypothetical protein
MMTQILALFAGHGLKFAAVLGMLAMIGTWDWKRIKAAEQRGKSELVHASQKQGAQNAAKSEQAHDSARKPGAIDRLRKDARTCADCSK